MKITKTSFGVTKNGEKATLYTMENANGMKVSVTDYGATIVKPACDVENENLPSTVILCKKNNYKILRQGAVKL